MAALGTAFSPVLLTKTVRYVSDSVSLMREHIRGVIATPLLFNQYISILRKSMNCFLDLPDPQMVALEREHHFEPVQYAFGVAELP